LFCALIINVYNDSISFKGACLSLYKDLQLPHESTKNSPLIMIKTKPSSARFTHLHTHSHYSLLQALPKIEDLVESAVDKGFASIAMTDAGNMYGAIDFYKECKKKNIKPIVGVDFYVAIRTRHDKESRIDNKRTRLVLLAKDSAGYKNLLKLVTESNLDGFYYKPRIDKELMEKYREGIVCIVPSFSGDLAVAIKSDNIERAKELTEFYKKTYGADFYLEITHHPEVQGHEENMKKLVAFARTENIPLVAAHDVYYLEKEDKLARNTVVAIQNEFSERSLEDEADFSMISPETAEEFFADIPDALDNCKKIVDECNLEITLGKWLFPEFKVESGLTPDEELRKLAYEGLATRHVELTDIVKERLEFELSVIQKKGYAAYFLTVADLLHYAHAHGILTNIRGSVAGSMTTYLTGITNVNPIDFKLPFERFLNPERPSAPDIDMDFADNRRDEMIAYSKQKYGADKVAQIGTFGTMMARGAVRDVARAMRHPHALGDQIAKMIPMGSQGFPMTIEIALDQTPELKKLYDTDPDVKSILDMAQKIEGNARHISVHAAGVVISPLPLTDVAPLQLDPKGEGRIITQYDMYAIDENNAGLMKFDFLGLKNLSQLAFAIDLVEKIEGVHVDLETIPYDDKKTFEMLARGETEGLFQLNGSGMTRFLKELKPTTIHDINAMVALYRPGPMEVIPDYIARKNNPALVKFEDPRMKAFLDQSYGLIVYQDDLLFCTIYLAGYTWLEADKFRKAVGKKIPAEMAALKEKFIEGIIKNGQTKKFADHLWTLFEPFQAYGFNKAHAASYGRVAYQTAYMKANFPAIYMASILTGTHGDVDEIALYVGECKRMGIPVLAPDINESYGNFTVVKGIPSSELMETDNNKKEKLGDKIRFGLYSIKNFGEGIADIIIAEREKNGKFKSLEDFLNRVKDRNLNKKSLESLVKCGAMDAFGDRGVMLANTTELLEFNKDQQSQHAEQGSFFDMMGNSASQLKLKPAESAKPADCLVWEKELLGLYVSGHPLDKYREILLKRELNIEKLKENGKEETAYIIAGIIEEAKEIATKKDKSIKMMFLKVADLSGSLEVVVFPKTYEQIKSVLIQESCVVIKGKFSKRNGTPSMILDSVRKLS